MALASELRAPPTHPAPSLKRPRFRMLKAMVCPLPISPSTFSTGTWQSLRMSGHVEDPRMPIFFSSAPTANPGKVRSTKNAVNFSPSILAKTTYRSANPALVIHIFSPFSKYCLPSAASVALHRAFSASDPEVLSERAYAPIHSPLVNLGRYFFFCCSLPKYTMGSVPMPACPPKLVLKLPHTAMRSAMMALEILSISAPPYSSGTSTVAMPISLALRSSSRTTAQSLCSIFSMLGMISFCANSSAVCAISLCCSLKSSGVKISSTLLSSSSQLPPWIFVFGITVAVAMVVSFSPPRHGVTEKNLNISLPLCLRVSVVQFLLQILENPCCPHAPAHAHGHQPVLAI